MADRLVNLKFIIKKIKWFVLFQGRTINLILLSDSKKKSVRCWSHLQKSEQMKKWKDTKYKIQEDKKVENKMIIGIDHGNRNMKTANTVFSAAIQPLQAKPDSLEHILEYQNQFY